MRYETLIGLRYIFSRKRDKHRNGFISFISIISILGTSLGVSALIVVLSVMNGFQEELRSRILGVASHIQITGYHAPLNQWPAVAAQALTHKEVIGAAPYITEQAMLSAGPQVRGSLIRGILPAQEQKVADFNRYMKNGSLNSLAAGKFNIVLGKDLANALHARVGQKITLIAPQGMVTPAAVLPRVKQFTITGIFEAGMNEYDAGLALIHLEDGQKLFRLGEQVSGVRLKLTDLFAAPRIGQELAQSITLPAYINDWTQSHANFFRAVKLEKNMMAIIVSLIIAVALFNVISTLVMVVEEKRADIAILRTLGASPLSIMMIFMQQGAFIGFIGIALGVVAGLLKAHNLSAVIQFIESVSGTTLWNKSVYYISEIPSKVLFSDVALIVAVSFALTLLVTLYPSWRAAHINPAQALRHE